MEFIDAKTIVSSYSDNNNWFGNNYNMNIYKGCNHGCIYCDSRSDCYQIEDFDRVRAKKDALQIIERDLAKKRKKGVVGTGAMSDPYNPFEKKYELTRGALKLIDKYNFGVSLITKSSLVVRDIDIIKKIQEHSPVLVKITVTTASDNMAKKIEPNVSSPSDRFEALKALTDNGIYAGILLMPVLPFIEDTLQNILAIIRKAHRNGAKFIYPAFGVTLRQNQRIHFYNKLDEHFPGMKQRYIKQFGYKYSCGSPRANELWELFKTECNRLNITYKMKDIISEYKSGYYYNQLSLF